MSKVLLSNGVFILCMILCFVFSLVCFIKFNSSDYVFVSSIGKNWSAGPISEVESSGYECPPGKVSLLDDFWAGTSTGCFCSGIFETLSTGTCSRKSSSVFCSSIYAIPPLPYRIWKGTNICGKRGPNYLELKNSKTSSGCGAGYKSCGKIDSMNNYLCYPNNIDCPYNSIVSISPNQIVPADKNYTVVPLGMNGQDGKLLFSNEDPNGKVVGKFKIDDNTPCLSPDYKNLIINPYKLEKIYGKDKCQNDIGGETVDNSYVKVDSISYNRLYSDNQILGILFSLPQFSTSYNYLNQQTSLYYKNYIGMDNRCINRLLSKNSASEILSDLVKIEDTISSNSTVALVGLIFASVGLFIIIVFSLVFCCSGADMGISLFLNIVGIILMTLPALIISSILVSKVNNTHFDLHVFTDPTCTDKITSSAVSDFSNNVESGKTMAYTYLAFSIIACICNIASFLFYYSP